MVTFKNDKGSGMSASTEQSANTKAECTMCKFVLYFAFFTLLLVLVFTFYFKLQTPPVREPTQNAEIGLIQ